MRTKSEILKNFQEVVLPGDAKVAQMEIFIDIRDQLERIADKMCEDPALAAQATAQKKALGL